MQTRKTYRNLKRNINNKNSAVVSGGKDSPIVIMETAYYITKTKTITSFGIIPVVFMSATNNTIENLKTFYGFLCRNFKNHSKLKKMLQISNHPAMLYGNAEMHKFES